MLRTMPGRTWSPWWRFWLQNGSNWWKTWFPVEIQCKLGWKRSQYCEQCLAGNEVHDEDLDSKIHCLKWGFFLPIWNINQIDKNCNVHQKDWWWMVEIRIEYKWFSMILLDPSYILMHNGNRLMMNGGDPDWIQMVVNNTFGSFWMHKAKIEIGLHLHSYTLDNQWYNGNYLIVTINLVEIRTFITHRWILEIFGHHNSVGSSYHS